MQSRGFTLLELLITMVLLAVIGTIIYSSFSTVVASVELTRAAAEELRVRHFLHKSFYANFTAAHMSAANFTAAALMYGPEGALVEMPPPLEGSSDNGPHGPADSVRFLSSAPISGNLGLPGQLKLVSYEVVTGASSKDGLTLGVESDDETRHQLVLEGTEAPWSASLFDTEATDLDLELDDTEEDALHWTVPVRSMDIVYFDGEEWLEEWDYPDRLPWCIHIRINFARTKEELRVETSQGMSPTDDPEFEMVIPIPMGLGT